MAFGLFSQDNDFFDIDGIGVVEVNSLCGSRSLIRLSKISPSILRHLNGFSGIPEYTVIRNEKSRMVTAFNKKVLARSSDIKKSILLIGNGIALDATFSSFVDGLIARKKQGLPIDKHFIPCSSISDNRITLQELCQKSDWLRSNLAEVNEKRSADLLGGAALSAKYLSSGDNKRVCTYLSLFI